MGMMKGWIQESLFGEFKETIHEHDADSIVSLPNKRNEEQEGEEYRILRLLMQRRVPAQVNI
jgi:hypothetical protein